KKEIKNLDQDFNNLIENINSIQKTFKINNNELLDNLNFIARVLNIINPLNNHLNKILGNQGSQKYLLLFQNNTELRPTGGFIGSYGILKIENGNIKELSIDDIYHLDVKVIDKLHNKVPEPLAKYLKMKEWYMRDCNWSPDFPTSAQDCLSLYYIESDDQEKIDGIIAITPTVIAELLNIIGAQEIEGIIFENENFTDDLQKAIELYYADRGDTHWTRKDIMNSLAQVIIQKIKNLKISDNAHLLELLSKNLDNKNILLYSSDQNVQKIFKNLDWSGDIKNKENEYYHPDYLMVVDSNLASSKSDQFIVRNVEYTIQEKNDNLLAQVKITYQHQGNFSWNSTKYRTYTRLLVPQGSELIKVEGSMENDQINKKGITDVYNDLNKTVFGTFIAIEPQETKSLIFEYKLPNRIKKQISENKYQIYIQKQPGIEFIPYTLKIKFDDDLKNCQSNIKNTVNEDTSDFKGEFIIYNDYFVGIKWGDNN
ncbi:DUF4012 domain-containing protein, partial [bacterium]|nr:DUF4012 domain-containing protein [bacterium]